MSKAQKRAEILSKQHEFWMGIKHALGMAPEWEDAPSPGNTCADGYSNNKIVHNSKECFQERLDNIQKGWKTSDALLFASMLFSIPLTVLFMWGWCGNNLMQVSAAATRAHWLKKLFEQSRTNKGRQDRIENISDSCGTVYLSTDEDVDMPFWYAGIEPDPECKGSPVELSRLVGGPGKATTRDEWLQCMNTRIGGRMACPSATVGQSRGRRTGVEALTDEGMCPPTSTYYLDSGALKMWGRAEAIADFAGRQAPPKPSLYVANAGAGQINGDAVSTLEYFSFWHKQYIIAPLMAWKMWMLSGIYGMYGGAGADIEAYKQAHRMHGDPQGTRVKISVAQCNQDKEKKSNLELLAWLLTPLFPFLILGVHFVETFYMFYLVIVAFFTQACGRVWPLNWPLWQKLLGSLAGFFDKEAAMVSERATNTGWAKAAVVVNWFGSLVSLVYLSVAAILTTILYLTLAVVAGFVFGPMFTMVMGAFTYLLGPYVGGDGWASGFAGHFMSVSGYHDSDYPRWLYIRKFKLALLVMSLVMTIFSKPVTMYLDPTLVAIMVLTVILAVVFPSVGSFVGLSSVTKAAAGAERSMAKGAATAPGVEKGTA